MESASVQLLTLPDSAFVTGVATNEKGSFKLGDVAKKNYTLRISFMGYNTVYQDVDLTKRNQKEVDLGRIMINSNARILNEAQVTAAVAKVKVEGDSLVYNASAYRVPEGSTLEALVRMLPGAEVDEDGNIKVNGKTVTKILLDGKEFFLNDKEVAMKNIPVDIIEKIKSYERKSDMARITGIDDGEEEMVLDLTVKKGMNHGWFGNATGGLGTHKMYNERAMVNYFDDVKKISLYGNARNTPNRWGWNNGRRSNQEAGTNVSTTTEKLETNGNVRYRHNGSDVYNISSSENFAAARGAFGENRNSNISSSYDVNFNYRLEWKPDTMTNVLFRPDFNLSRGHNQSDDMSGSYDTDPNLLGVNALDYNQQIQAWDGLPTTDQILQNLLDIVVNTNSSRNQSENRNVRGGGELQYNRKFNDKGRNLTFRVNGSYNEGQNKQLSAANITYNSLGTARQNNRFYETPSRNANIGAQVTYNEPIADRTYLQFSYRYNYSYNRNNRMAHVYDSQAFTDLYNALHDYRYDIDGILRFMEEANYMMRDTVALSQFSEYRNYNQTITAQLRRVRTEYNFSVGLNAYPQHTVLNYRYMGHDYPEVKRTVFNMAPYVNLKWNFDKQTNLQARYNGRSNQPGMTNLLDIKDDSNPLYISKGNPGLKPSFSHSVNLNFNTYNSDAQRGIWAWGNVNAEQNRISNKTTYDPVTGVRTTMPMNINGNWNTGAGVGMNTGLGKKKLFTVGANAGGNYNHSVGFYNNATSDATDNQDIKSITDRIQLDGRLSTAFRNDYWNVELNGNINYSHAVNNVNVNANTDTYNFSYGGWIQYKAPWGTEFNTDMRMSSRRGYAQKNMNTNELLWNASIAHSFLQGRALTLRAEVFDILHQQTNISRSIDAFMRRDSQNNTVYQYAMFSVIYRFSIFGGQNTMGTDKERKE